MASPTSEQLIRAMTAETRKVTDADDRRNGMSTVLMPDGSHVCVSHQAPTELQLSLTREWFAARRQAAAW